MMKPKTISPENPPVTSMNYQALLSEGLEEIIRYSGEIWTDHNESDPGITILELLCYVLTDLGYRTNYPIEDILTNKPHGNIKAGENAFFPPSTIFPTNPLTPGDYRKLLLSKFHELQNVWINPIKPNKNTPQGLYNIRLQFSSDHKKEKKEIFPKIIEKLNQHRNLCEDYQSVKAVKDKIVHLQTRVVIKPGSDANYVTAKILWKLNEFLAPYIPRWTKEELQKQGWSLSKIYDGPTQPYGFIKTKDLKPFKKKILFSDLVEVVNEIEEVERVEYLTLDHLQQTFINTDNRLLKIPLTGNDIQLYEKNILLKTKSNSVEYYYKKVREEESRNYCISLQEDLKEIPQGTFQDIKNYYSLQRELPAIYQVDEEKVRKNGSALRKAQSKQLKAYLLFFEQYLANYLSQLAHTKDLFSIESNIDQTYYGQVPKNVPLLKEVVVPKFAGKLQELIKKLDPFLERRSKFVNHLLARFSEELPAPTLAQLSMQEEGNPLSQDQYVSKKIDLELKFLRQYENLSTNRGRAFNYLKSTTAPADTAGLYKRLQLFLDDPAFNFYIIENILLRPQKKRKDAGFWVTSSKEEILLRNRFFTTKAERNTRLKLLDTLIKDSKNYKIKKTPLPYDDLPWQVILMDGNKEIAQSTISCATEKEAQGLKKSLHSALKKHGSNLDKQKINLGPNFFSNRLTIILPKIAKQKETITIFKDLVRLNAPAQVGVCYVEIPTSPSNLMSSFLAYYNAWLLNLEGKHTDTYINPINRSESASLLINFLIDNQAFPLSYFKKIR